MSLSSNNKTDLIVFSFFISLKRDLCIILAWITNQHLLTNKYATKPQDKFFLMKTNAIGINQPQNHIFKEHVVYNSISHSVHLYTVVCIETSLLYTKTLISCSFFYK